MKNVLFSCAIACLIALNLTSCKTNCTALAFAYSPANNVYEDENIKLEIYNEELWATNKTSKTIFIDYAQCFAFHNGASFPLFQNNNKRQGDEKASKVGISSKEEAYLTIAPSVGSKQNETFICNIATRFYRNYPTWETPFHDFTDYEERFLKVVKELLEESKNANPHAGTAVRHLTEDESIINIGASIAYAFSKNAEEWTNVSISTWVSDVIFAPYYVEKAKKLTMSEKKGFEIKETAPAIIHIKADSPFEFDEDRSPIVLCDWMGYYEKGTFTLRDIRKQAKLYSSLIGYHKSIIHFDGKNATWKKRK